MCELGRVVWNELPHDDPHRALGETMAGGILISCRNPNEFSSVQLVAFGLGLTGVLMRSGRGQESLYGHGEDAALGVETRIERCDGLLASDVFEYQPASVIV